MFNCSAVARANPSLESLTPTASGVLAVRLSSASPDYLMWFRKEQLLTVTWAGDPTKPVVGNDPLELSPRRSFAAWSEIVRGTALPWTGGEIALAGAFGGSLVDIILQVNAVRLLIAEHQLSQTRAAVANSREPVIIVDAGLRILFANDAFYQLARRPRDTRPTLDAIASHFSEPAQVHDMLDTLAQERRAWRGELGIVMEDGAALHVGVRAEVVPARDGSVLGFFLIFNDLTQSLRAAAARRQLEQSLSEAKRSGLALDAQGGVTGATDEVMAAVLANASIAAMDITDGGAGPSVAAMLEEMTSPPSAPPCCTGSCASSRVPERGLFNGGRVGQAGGGELLEQLAVPAERILCFRDDPVPGAHIGRHLRQLLAELCCQPCLGRVAEVVERDADQACRQCQAAADDALELLPATEVAQVPHVGMGQQQFGLVAGQVLQAQAIGLAGRQDADRAGPTGAMQRVQIAGQCGRAKKPRVVQGREQGMAPALPVPLPGRHTTRAGCAAAGNRMCAPICPRSKVRMNVLRSTSVCNEWVPWRRASARPAVTGTS